jgi:predicted AAA+ superfamily ATPase
METDDNYVVRAYDSLLSEYLNIFRAILIKGPKWCGKTWLCYKPCNSKIEVADPSDNFRIRKSVELDIMKALEGEQPHLIDEWQEVPSVWDAVRFTVDKNNVPGQYILTGSSTPKDNSTIHSGAGRFGILEMSTMTLKEKGVSKGSVDLECLFDEFDYKNLVGTKGELRVEDIIREMIKGGWPALLSKSVKSAQTEINSYLNLIVNEDVSRVDDIDREPEKMRALIQSLSRNIASLATKKTLEDDIEVHNQSLSKNTIGDYLLALKKIFIYEEVAPWHPALKSKIRTRHSSKIMLADVSLAISAVGANEKSLLKDLKFVGNLFEGLVLHDLKVLASLIDSKVKHYHDNSDLEVDAIIEQRNGDYGAIEIKLGYPQIDKAVYNLNRFKSKMLKNDQKPPSFLAVVVGVGSVFEIKDGVYVIPVDLL